MHNSVLVFPIVFLPVCIWAGGDTFAQGGWDGVVGCDDAQGSTTSAPAQCARVHFVFVFPFSFDFYTILCDSVSIIHSLHTSLVELNQCIASFSRKHVENRRIQ